MLRMPLKIVRKIEASPQRGIEASHSTPFIHNECSFVMDPFWNEIVPVSNECACPILPSFGRYSPRRPSKSRFPMQTAICRSPPSLSLPLQFRTPSIMMACFQLLSCIPPAQRSTFALEIHLPRSVLVSVFPSDKRNPLLMSYFRARMQYFFSTK